MGLKMFLDKCTWAIFSFFYSNIVDAYSNIVDAYSNIVDAYSNIVDAYYR